MPHRVSEKRLRLIIDAAPTGVVVVDECSKIDFVNRKVEQKLGYNREELIGKHLDVLFPTNQLLELQNLDRFASTFEESNFEESKNLKIKSKDGQLISVHIAVTRIEADADNFLLISIADDSETRRAEERLKLVVEAAPSGMIMVDESGKIALVNAQVEKMFGYVRDELIGETIDILVPQAIRAKHPAHRAEFFADPKVRAMGAGRDLYGQKRDGTEVPVEIGLNPLMTQGERYVVASIVDITQRKQAESMLQEKLLELQRSNADLEQFAYVCSHDLQEPLRVIGNYTQLLAKRYQDRLDEDGTEFIEFILDATKRMQELIDDLLLYSRVNAKGREFELTDCNKVARKALSNLAISVEESHATIAIETLPTVMSDGSQLLQLFQNLIGNAIKFRSAETPQIQISADKVDGNWKFAVTDNGKGFDMRHAERIFVIFQRLHDRETYPGSGIGLAICKKIVERHGGRIWVESECGSGTTFYFTLPAAASKGRNE